MKDYTHSLYKYNIISWTEKSYISNHMNGRNEGFVVSVMIWGEVKKNIYYRRNHLLYCKDIQNFIAYVIFQFVGINTAIMCTLFGLIIHTWIFIHTAWENIVYIIYCRIHIYPQTNDTWKITFYFYTSHNICKYS